MSKPRSKALAFGLGMFGVSVAAAVVIYFTHPVDPHDEGSLVGTAAFLWPFFLLPLAWLVCAGLVVADFRRDLRGRAAVGLLAATIAWPIIFIGYPLNQKPWLSAQEKLEDPWPDVRARGALLLGQEGSTDSLPLLAAALADRDSEVRAAGATALGRYGPRAQPVVPALVRTLDDQDWFVGCQAAEALGGMRGFEVQVLPPLLAQIDGGDLRPWCAVKAIARLGPGAAPAVPTLTALLRHEDPNLRSAAAEAFGHIGPAAAAALPDLKSAVADENQWVRKAAVEAVPRVEGSQ